ncbi:hypothetical protein BC938DRAFT_474152 [Jimgerdemannia flammicorona]|uniref:ORC1/DEAH AAA+ ATPase domain-containing protein n=1 Tax=Jimgerdemannia flammicorona TaxID=994334 RepID=A0A433Q2N6_9FUNG|nr:hypothetical protein BC938DRAFT_474152 [Jimgerdemannia flammicorona]
MFNFFIEPKILEVFGSYLLQRKFCLLFGHRQSGKTTICQALMRWFQQHPEKFTELAGVSADRGPKVFWEAVCRKFLYLDPERFYFNDTVMDSATFQGFFSKRAHPSSKPIILIIDETSRLTSVGGTVSEATKEVTDEFISALRSLKNANDYSLHAVALVGTESIRELLIVHNKPGASSKISPFTEEATWMAGRAPILRSLILSSITIPQIGLSQSVPDEKKLDPQWLLARTIESLCLRHLCSPQALNADKNPSEYAFQSEFVTVFRNLIPSAYPLLRYKILVEVKERDEDGVRNQRLDILVRNGNSLPSYGFELVVAASKKEFDEHCARAEKYGELQGCEMFMINLCPKVMLREYFGERSYDLTPVNVVIDPDERKGIIRYAKNDEPVSITGSDWDMLFNWED